MKKVGLNIFPLERPKWSGIEIYTFELLTYLKAANIELSAFSLKRIENEDVTSGLSYKYIESKESGAFRKLYFNLLGISSLIGRDLDVFHSTMFSLPYNLKAKKKIITIHDFAFLRFPELFDYKTKLFYKLTLDYAIESADRIICISKSCLEDLNYYYPSSKISDKARLIYNGFRDYSALASDSGKSGIKNYLLSVGATHSRKNVRRMLEAFKIILSARPELTFIFVGSVNRAVVEEFLIANPELLNKVVLTGYVDDLQLAEYYKNALLVMFVSIYEGFGFPILEAMKCGTPVLTSNTSSCQELVPYGTNYIADPFDVSDIADKAIRMLEDKNRAELIRLGLLRASDFSWRNMCEETVELYFE